MSFRHRPLMTSVYECTLVMGRMLDLPSVIELAPRVYFYFGVQKKLISTNDIYIFFFFFVCNCSVDSSKYYTHQT